MRDDLKDIRSAGGSVLFVAFGLVFTAFYAIYPCMNDDFWFLEQWPAFFDAPSWHSFFSNWADSVKFRYEFDNGRLSNIISTALLVMPKIVPALFISGSLCLGIWFGARIAGIWRRNLLLFTLMLFMVMFAMPWNDFMFGVVYACNYIPPTALTLWVLTLFLKGRLRHVIPAFLLGLITAWTHEQYGAMLLAGIWAPAVFYRRYRTCAAVAVTTGALLALGYLFTAPGTSVRMSDMDPLYGLMHPLYGIVHAHVFIIFVVLTLASASVRSWRPALCSPAFSALAGMTITGFVLWRLFVARLHVACGMDFMAIVSVIYLLRHVPLSLRPQWLRIAATLTMILLMAVHVALCLPWFMRMHREVDDARAMQNDCPRQTVFADLTTPFEAPSYLLGKPNFNAYTIWATGLDRAVPLALETFIPGKAAIIGEGCEAWLYGGYHIVVPFSDVYVQARNDIRIVIGGVDIAAEPTFIPFVGADDNIYYYLRPLRIPQRLAESRIERLYIECVK